MNRKHSILIIDDTDSLPEAISSQLSKKNYKVLAVNTVAQARERLRGDDPPTFILADRMLETGAIEVRELGRLCREAAAVAAEVLVYTNKINLTDEQHNKILNLGAYRVLDKDDVDKFKNDIDVLIQDFDERADLTAELNADSSDERIKFITALIGSDVSLSVLDHRYVHRYSNTAPELLSKAILDRPTESPSVRVGVCQRQCWLTENDQLPKQHQCWGCTVEAVFASNRTIEGLFLSRQPNGAVRWVDVQSKPIKSHKQNTIAVREAVGEANEVVLSNLTLERRLSLIAQSLIRAGFGRARIYTFDMNGAVANLRAAASWSDDPLNPKSEYFDSIRSLSLDLDSPDGCPYAKAADESRFGSLVESWTEADKVSPLKAKLKLEPPYFDVPVYRENGRLHSWISVDFVDMPEPLRTRAIRQYVKKETAIWLQEEFGREVRLADFTEGKHGYREKFEAARRARFGIANAKSVEDAIKEISSAFKALVPRCRVSVRIKRGDTLQEFEKLCWGEAAEPAQANFSLDNADSLSVAVVKHPLPKWIDNYPEYVANALTNGEPPGCPPKGTQSTAQIPLKLENIVFGTLRIDSPETIQWGAEGYKEPLIMLARDIALVLRDLALQEEIDKAMDERAAMIAYSVSVSADGLWRHWAQQRLSEVSARLGIIRTELDTGKPRAHDLVKNLIAVGDVITRIQTAQLAKDAPSSSSIRTVLTRLGEIYSGKKPIPTFTWSEDLMVEVPEFILRDILMILVDNALTSIESSGTGTMIRLTATSEKDSLSVEVLDDGPGIPPDVQARIFRGFVQSNKGRGLGLLYARGAALNYHGDLTFISSPGLTRFTLSLPLHKSTEGVEE
jgi:CheY-like chemotaxis protein